MNEQVFLNTLGGILTIAIGALATFISSYFKASKNAKTAQALGHAVATAEAQVAAKKGLAYDAVLFAEDAWDAVKGNSKLDVAVEWAVKEAKKRGIDVSDTAVKGLIRTQYQVLKTKLQAAIPTDNVVPAVVVSKAAKNDEPANTAPATPVVPVAVAQTAQVDASTPATVESATPVVETVASTTDTVPAATPAVEAATPVVQVAVIPVADVAAATTQTAAAAAASTAEQVATPAAVATTSADAIAAAVTAANDAISTLQATVAAVATTTGTVATPTVS